MAVAEAPKAEQGGAERLGVLQEPVICSGNYRYLKLALILVLLSIAIYVYHTPLGQANGGTWVGYTLGTVAALLIVWLGWYGIRKRRYGIGNMMLQEWLSAHVYLGLSVIVIATLHAGFQVGWNVHTLAYVLMLIAILSGIWGIYLYIALPARMSKNRGGITLDQVVALIADLDRNSLTLSVKLGDDINDLVRDAVENTRIGGGMARQLSGRDPACPTARALDGVSDLVKVSSGTDAEVGRQLVFDLARKNRLLTVARLDVKYRAWLNMWLLIHVPATVGLVGALIAHIVSVFFYW